MEDLFDFGGQNNTLGCTELNFESLFDCNYPYEQNDQLPKDQLQEDELPTISSNVAEENRLDDIEIDQGLNDAAGFDLDLNFLGEKACKDPNESSFGGKRNIHDGETNTDFGPSVPVHSNTGKLESGNFKASTKTSHRVSPYPIHSKVQNQQTLDQNQFDQIKPYPDAYCNSNILAIEPSCSQSPIEYVEEEPPLYDPISPCGDVGSIHHFHGHNTHFESGDVGLSEQKDMEVFVKCPETFRTYSIGVHAFAEILEKNGTPLEAARPQKRSPQQIEEIVKKFCNARDLSFMKSEHAQEVIDSGREITKIPLKGKKEDGAYPCLICPSLQGHGRGFQRKEDLKRHYQLHFKYARFTCNHCQYGNSRTDHMKLHIQKCHPGKDQRDYKTNC